MAAILYDLLNESPNIKIEISLANLIEAVDYAAKLSIAELDKQRQIQPEQYLTRKQTAEMLDVDLSTLWRWHKKNYLCAVEVGGKRRYKLSEVNKILRKGEVVL
jgi:excisionase family DNA binding protein